MRGKGAEDNHVADEMDDLLDRITGLLPRVLGMLDTLSAIGRHMHPPHLPRLVELLANDDDTLRVALGTFSDGTWSESLQPFKRQMVLAADLTLRACQGLREAAASGDGRIGAWRAMRHHTRAIEALYPLTTILPFVNRWFVNPARREDQALLDSLARPQPDTGIIHAGNEPGSRGGFSVYVPEFHEPGHPLPLVMALHGGAGHGRLFLWSWVREARSRGMIVVAPTALGDTWSLMEPDIDSRNLGRILKHVRERWDIDPQRVLLTGMSDGGTFTLLSGLRDDSPFTHLAPVAASFHPLLVTMTEPERIRGLPIYLVHGALDWMFPVTVGRTANRTLSAAGAAVTYREIDDLSHVYPQDENERIGAWLAGS